MNVELAMDPLSCSLLPPGSPLEIVQVAEGLVRLAKSRHGDQVDPFVETAATLDMEAAFSVASHPTEFGLFDDEGLAWMWVAGSVGHPGAVHQMIAISRLRAMVEAADDSNHLQESSEVSRSWMQFGEEAAVPEEEVRDPQQLASAARRQSVQVAQAATAPVIEGAEKGIVVLTEIGDPTSKEGVDLGRRFGMFANVRLGWQARLPAPGELHDAIVARWPWAVDAARAIENNFALLRAGDGERVKLSPLLLVGDKGSGKTSIARFVCEFAGLHTTVMPCGGVSDAGGLASVTRGWSTARPSAVITTMLQKRICNPAFVLDELDKSSVVGNTNGSVMGSLLSLVLSDSYFDLCLQSTVDISGVSFVATANDLGKIDEFLRDRFTIVRVPSPRACDFDVLLANVREDFIKSERVDAERVPMLGNDQIRILRGLVAGNRSARSFRLYYETIVKSMIARQEQDMVRADALREKLIAECMAEDAAPGMLN